MKILNKPSYYNNNPWEIIIIASLLVGFLLGFLQPFGIDKINEGIRPFIILGFTLITAICTTIVGYVFPLLFKKFYTPSKWTIGKSLINQSVLIILIALGNFLFDWCISDRPIETFGSVLLSYMLVTVIIAVIPMIIASFIIKNHQLKSNLKNAEIINKKISELPKKSHETVTLTGDTKKSILLNPQDLLYMESVGNYVKGVYLSENTIKHKQIRSTISVMEKELSEYSYIKRCHRAFLVNTNHIINAEGNSQGLHLHLDHIKESIPVSRSYVKIFREDS